MDYQVGSTNVRSPSKILGESIRAPVLVQTKPSPNKTVVEQIYIRSYFKYHWPVGETPASFAMPVPVTGLL